MNKYFRKEQLPLYIVGIISLVVVGFVVNYTYSFFAVNKTNNNVIAGEAESMSIDLKVEKKAPNNDNKLVPQLDEYITSAVKGVNGSCVDGNNNNICQVYKITVKNGGSSTVPFNGEVVLDAKENPNLKWAVISGEATSGAKPTLKSNAYSHTHKQLTTKEEYKGGQIKEYYIVVWISETGIEQTDTGKFTGVVNFNTASESENGGDLALTTLTSLGLTLSEGTPIFDKTSCSEGCEETTVGVYSAEDDLGTSYYFRGDVENNYVKFGKKTTRTYNNYEAEFYDSLEACEAAGLINCTCPEDRNGECFGFRLAYKFATVEECEEAILDGYCETSITEGEDMYWRIIRINGDGTIRLILQDSINSELYSPDYMYGDRFAETYEDVHENINNSDVKQNLDDWYEINFVNKAYEEYIADAIYCNDRKVYLGTGIGYYPEDWDDPDAELMFEKYKTTLYQAYKRLGIDKNPSFICPQNNDKFTKEENIGNGKLTYPIATITADEIAFAGAVYGKINKNIYLLDSYRDDYNGIMSMTPIGNGAQLNSESESIELASMSKAGGFGFQYDFGGYDLHPVISLKSGLTFSGNGSSESPFEIVG